MNRINLRDWSQFVTWAHAHRFGVNLYRPKSHLSGEDNYYRIRAFRNGGNGFELTRGDLQDAIRDIKKKILALKLGEQ